MCPTRAHAYNSRGAGGKAKRGGGLDLAAGGAAFLLASPMAGLEGSELGKGPSSSLPASSSRGGGTCGAAAAVSSLVLTRKRKKKELARRAFEEDGDEDGFAPLDPTNWRAKTVGR